MQNRFISLIAVLLVLCFIAAILLMSCVTAPVKPQEAARGNYEYTKQYLSWLIKKEMKKNNVTVNLLETKLDFAGFLATDSWNCLPVWWPIRPESCARPGCSSC